MLGNVVCISSQMHEFYMLYPFMKYTSMCSFIDTPLLPQSKCARDLPIRSNRKQEPMKGLLHVLCTSATEVS